ncbi:MAG TPA: serpin family protein [Methanoregula sp.]|nr:serpin family protein [Methanoregula sp.]
MKHKSVVLLAVLSVIASAVFIAGCASILKTNATQVSPTPSASPLPGITPGGQGLSASTGTSVVDANNQFTHDLFREISLNQTTGNDNILFSPFSISSALAITYEGARGNTADEIRSVFYFPENSTSMREGFALLNAGINSKDAGYTLSTANALWAEKTYPFLPEYIGTAETYYAANTTNLDFKGQPEASRQSINSWLEDKTNNKIKDLLPPGSIAPITRLVITNAVYFKGTWQKQFDANKTADAPFRKPDGTTVTVKMMQRTDKDAVYPYTENADLQVITLPYTSTSGKGLSMLVLLPKDDDLSTIDQYLDPVNLSALTQSESSRRVMVYFPKFKIETRYSLPKTLGTMGMPTAFSDRADFSGMDGTKILYISDAIHKAYIDVNEEGTEAAAATAVVMWVKAVETEEPVPVFRADHPFVFLIQDDDSGAILFAGRITNPGNT